MRHVFSGFSGLLFTSDYHFITKHDRKELTQGHVRHHKFFSSHVSLALPGVGPGLAAKLHPDGPGFEQQKHRRWRVKGLVFGEDGVMRGVGVKKLQKTQPRESDIRERRKAMQCSVGSQMHLSDWNLWWQVTGVFGMYWPDPGPKKENQFITLHDNSISALSFFFVNSKTRHPVILKF